MDKIKELMHAYKRAIAVGVIFFVVGWVPVPGLAISISPGKIIVPSILRNSVQTKTVTIGRSADDVNNKTTYSVTPRGEFAEYIKGPAEFTMQAGEQTAEYSFDIASEDAANGTYEVFLDIVPLASGQDAQTIKTGYVSATVSVVSGVTLIVNFTVGGDEIVNFTVDNLQVKDTEVDQPLLASIDVNNTGNVDWKPNAIELILTAINDPNNSVTTTIAQADLSATKAGSKQTIDFVTSAPDNAERYRASAKIYYQDKVVTELISSNIVTVYSPGTMMQKGELISLTSNKTKYKPNEKIKVEGRFKNTGEIAIQGVLITEIYQGDDMYDLVRSSEYTVDMNEEVVFSQIMQLANTGTYTLSSYVEFGDKATAPQTLTFSVNSAILSVLSSPLGSGIVLSSIIFVIMSGAIYTRHYRRSKKKKKS